MEPNSASHFSQCGALQRGLRQIRPSNPASSPADLPTPHSQPQHAPQAGPKASTRYHPRPPHSQPPRASVADRCISSHRSRRLPNVLKPPHRRPLTTVRNARNTLSHPCNPPSSLRHHNTSLGPGASGRTTVPFPIISNKYLTCNAIPQRSPATHRNEETKRSAG